MYESGLKTLGLVEQVGCVTRGSTNEIVFTCFYPMLCKENVGCYVHYTKAGKQKRRIASERAGTGKDGS